MATQKGYFRPINRHKYMGDATKIVYRSSWELRQMSRFDLNPAVVAWSSESVVVPYLDRTRKTASGFAFRRYYPDFLVKFKTADGKILTQMIEIKPKKESRPPVMGKGKNAQKRYIQEAKTFGTNICKWEAAKRYCADRGWQFVVLTEEELGIL
jgi:hypothetical protein